MTFVEVKKAQGGLARPPENLFRKFDVPAEFNLPLHGMRGIAALIVVLFHVAGVLKNPASAYLNGHAAVAFFFILSGLVLGLSLRRSELGVTSYIEYGVRRAFRLLPLLFVTATLGALYLWFADPFLPHSVAYEGQKLTVPQYAAGLIGFSLKPNGPSWSIFVELVASALIPLMFFAGRSALIFFGAFAAILGFSSINLDLQHHWNFYLINFFAGLSILWWGGYLQPVLERANPFAIGAAAAVCLCAAYLSRLMTGPYAFGDPRINLLETALFTPFIALVFLRPQMFNALATPAMRYLGELSFSIYLTHWLLLAATFNAAVLVLGSFTESPAFGVLYSLALIAICICVSIVTYKLIERPGMSCGKAVAPRIANFRLSARGGAHPLKAPAE